MTFYDCFVPSLHIYEEKSNLPKKKKPTETYSLPREIHTQHIYNQEKLKQGDTKLVHKYLLYVI